MFLIIPIKTLFMLDTEHVTRTRMYLFGLHYTYNIICLTYMYVNDVGSTCTYCDVVERL